MSSHVAHQDVDGIGIVWDRNQRSEVRRNAMELAHGARMLGEIVLMTLLRARALFKMLGLDTSVLKPFFDQYAVLHQETSSAGEIFHAVEYADESVSSNEAGVCEQKESPGGPGS